MFGQRGLLQLLLNLKRELPRLCHHGSRCGRHLKRRQRLIDTFRCRVRRKAGFIEGGLYGRWGGFRSWRKGRIRVGHNRHLRQSE